MKICWARPQLVFTFDSRFSSTVWAVHSLFGTEFSASKRVTCLLPATQAESHAGSKVGIWNVFGINHQKNYVKPRSIHTRPIGLFVQLTSLNIQDFYVLRPLSVHVLQAYPYKAYGAIHTWSTGISLQCMVYWLIHTRLLSHNSPEKLS